MGDMQRVHIGDGARESWANPDIRERRIAGNKASWAKKRAARIAAQPPVLGFDAIRVHGGTVAASAIPRDPLELEIFGDATA